MENVHLLCDGCNGVYLPSVWTSKTINIWGILEDEWEFISDKNNINKDWYWEAWDYILNNAKFIDSTGVIWTLYQEGDLWAVAWDEMTEEEKERFCGQV